MHKYWYKLAFSILLLIGLLPAAIFAQGGAYGEEEDYFIGSITYSFEGEGLAKTLLKYTNPIQYMRMHIRKGDYIVHLYGENDYQRHDRDLLKPFPTTRMFLADSNRMYTLDMDLGVAYKHEVYDNPIKDRPKAEPIGDTVTIKGYQCAGYRYIIPGHKHKWGDLKEQDPADTVTLYVTDSIKVNKAYYKGKDQAKASFLVRGLEGRIPLKTIRENRKRKITIKAIKVKRRKLSKKQFRIPPNIKVTERMDNRR
jgi:hypothetical protein